MDTNVTLEISWAISKEKTRDSNGFDGSLSRVLFIFYE